ncbi:protein kinase domain-containing protein [Pantanalinema rosaneae CENA516]|uniref:protein kinase domain-containing protein n=1 Tax=Pantanalinema rosaneae TaxID=1620701 RepID=UPI003D6DCB15
MNLDEPKRNRDSFFITDEARKLLEEQREKLATQEEINHVSFEYLQNLIAESNGGVDKNRTVISNIFGQKKRAERHSIQLLFSALNLELKEEYLTRTPPQRYSDSSPETGFFVREKPHDIDAYSSQESPLDTLVSAKLSTTTKQKSFNNWLIEDRITPWITASNGLQYRVFRLREKYLNRIDRGKCYDIRYLSTDEQKALQSKLSRHKKVVDLLTERQVKGIPVNRTALLDNPEEPYEWWVIDQWIEGDTVETLVKNKQFSRTDILPFARCLLTTLHELHTAGIILRDLHTRSIVIRTDKQPFVLDFELAKIITGKSSVANRGLIANPFRAPELVEGDENPTVEADLYSWAMILVAIATENLQPQRADLPHCINVLPKKLYQQVAACLSILPDERPHSAKEISKALSFWRLGGTRGRT